MKFPTTRRTARGLLGILLLLGAVTTRAAQNQYQLTIHVIGIPQAQPGTYATGAVGVIPIGQACTNSGSPTGSFDCTYIVSAGTFLRVSANSPYPSAPGTFSLFSGSAASGDVVAGCTLGTSTCYFTINSDSALTATFDSPANTQSFNVSITFNGTGEVHMDGNRCQNLDGNPNLETQVASFLPVQPSACISSYAQGSWITLEEAAPAAARFSGFSLGTNNAGGCTTAIAGTCSSFQLNGNTSVGASFAALQSITVDPPSATIPLGGSQKFKANGSFADSVTEQITPGPGSGLIPWS